jgi:hypothetical protein
MPKKLSNHMITTITTTIFNIVLIEEAMGKKLLMSQSTTPTMIRTNTT